MKAVVFASCSAAILALTPSLTLVNAGTELPSGTPASLKEQICIARPGCPPHAKQRVEVQPDQDATGSIMYETIGGKDVYGAWVQKVTTELHLDWVTVTPNCAERIIQQFIFSFSIYEYSTLAGASAIRGLLDDFVVLGYGRAQWRFQKGEMKWILASAFKDPTFIQHLEQRVHGARLEQEQHAERSQVHPTSAADGASRHASSSANRRHRDRLLSELRGRAAGLG
jgi:hypothetical protein